MLFEAMYRKCASAGKPFKSDAGRSQPLRAGTSRGFHHQQGAVAALTAPAFVLVLRVRRSVKWPSVPRDSFPTQKMDSGNYRKNKREVKNVGRRKGDSYL